MSSATAVMACTFTGLVALSVVGSFGFQAYHMWKTKNFRFLHKDIFVLFFLTALFFSIAFVAGDLLKDMNNNQWLNSSVKWTWVGFSIFMSLACLGLLSFSVLNNESNVEVSGEVTDDVSDLHSYGSSEGGSTFTEEVDPSVEGYADPLFEGGAVSSNLQANI